MQMKKYNKKTSKSTCIFQKLSNITNTEANFGSSYEIISLTRKFSTTS